MPGFAAHCLLAHRTLATWSADAALPFSASDACRNAFLNGAVGPDMGLFSPPDALISDLAHYVRTGDLCRALVGRAGDDPQAAYAWGWVSHVLADVALHGLVNRAVGQLLTGDAEQSISYAADPVAHVRVEMALDAFCFGELAPSEPATFVPALDATSVDFVAAAFDATYGKGVVEKSQLLRAHRVCARYSRGLCQLNTIHYAGQQGRWAPLRSWPFYCTIFLPSKWWSYLRPRGLAYAACHPAELPDWVVEETRTQVERFPQVFSSQVNGKLVDLPNYNLDLGSEESASDPYPLTTETVRRWKARRREVRGAVTSGETRSA